MKDTTQKQLTSLVRAMKTSLAKNHGITVPHSALRASYLQAMGENPHAFSGATTSSPKAKTKVSPESPDRVRKTLYLVEDEMGCLVRLALDAEGDYPISEDWMFYDATVEALFAEIPSVNKYGLPDYLAGPGPFFADNFGLSTAKPWNPTVKNLGDDSGDTCRIEVSMPLAHWSQLIYEVIEQEGQWSDVCEWVGLHHRKVLKSESEEQQTEWMERYLEAQAIPAPATLTVKFEWVYPDADSDYRSATLDLATGVVTPTETLPDIAYSHEVDQRIVLDEEGDDMFDLHFNGTSKTWHVTAKALEDIQDLQD